MSLQDENTRFLQSQIQYLSTRLAELANENDELHAQVAAQEADLTTLKERLDVFNGAEEDEAIEAKPRPARKGRAVQA